MPVSVGGFVPRSTAERSRSYLSQHGISAEIAADAGGRAAPRGSHTTGGVYLIVAREDAETARDLIQQLEPRVDPGHGDAEPSATLVNQMGRWALGAVIVALLLANALVVLAGG